MNNRALTGVSLAVALGTLIGGGVLCKPTISNNSYAVSSSKVISNKKIMAKSSNKNVVKIVAYEYTSANPYKEWQNDSGIFTHYSLKTGKEIKDSKKIAPIASVSIKNYSGTTPSIYTLNLKKVILEIPVGAKVDLMQWNGFYSVIEYEGHSYRIPTDYLDLKAYNNNSPNYFATYNTKYNLNSISQETRKRENYEAECIARVITKEKKDKVKVIGTAETKDFIFSTDHKISPRDTRNYTFDVEPIITTEYNGSSYSFKVAPGSKVNLVEVNESPGFTMHIPKDTRQQYVEYNGVVGYISYNNLSKVNLSK